MTNTMTGGDEVLDDQVNFDIDLELEEDIVAELEEFILLARLGAVDEASALVRNVLWPHTYLFPVFAEVSGFLAEHDIGSLRALLQKLTSQNFSFADDDEKEFFDVVSILTGDKTTTSPDNRDALTYYLKQARFEYENSKVSPVVAHLIELRLGYWAAHPLEPDSPTSKDKLLTYVLDHIQWLIVVGLHWEAAQIFGILCKLKYDGISPTYNISQKPLDSDTLQDIDLSFITSLYHQLTSLVNGRALLKMLCVDSSANQIDIPVALTLLSAGASLMRRAMIHSWSQKSCHIFSDLRQEMTILMETLFADRLGIEPCGEYVNLLREADTTFSVPSSPEVFALELRAVMPGSVPPLDLERSTNPSEAGYDSFEFEMWPTSVLDPQPDLADRGSKPEAPLRLESDSQMLDFN